MRVIIPARYASTRLPGKALQSRRVIEQGTHQELIGAGGVYASLHQMQFSDRRN